MSWECGLFGRASVETEGGTGGNPGGPPISDPIYNFVMK